MTGMSYALDALRSDAKVWEEVSSALDQARMATSTVVTSCQFSKEGEDAYRVYERLTHLVTDLLREGSLEAGLMADALLSVRQSFESNEESARASFSGVWEPRG